MYRLCFRWFRTWFQMRGGPDQISYLPIVYVDELSLRIRDLRIVNKTDDFSMVDINYKPITYGKLRLFLQVWSE